MSKQYDFFLFCCFNIVNNVGAMDYPQFFLNMPIERIWQLININIGAATLVGRHFSQGASQYEMRVYTYAIRHFQNDPGTSFCLDPYKDKC